METAEQVLEPIPIHIRIHRNGENILRRVFVVRRETVQLALAEHISGLGTEYLLAIEIDRLPRVFLSRVAARQLDGLAVRSHLIRPVVIAPNLRIERHFHQHKMHYRLGHTTVVFAAAVAALVGQVEQCHLHLIPCEIKHFAPFGLVDIMHGHGYFGHYRHAPEQVQQVHIRHRAHRTHLGVITHRLVLGQEISVFVQKRQRIVAQPHELEQIPP